MRNNRLRSSGIYKLIIMLMLIIPLIFTGCKKDINEGDIETKDKETSTNVDSSINKVVTTYKPATDLVLALGAVDKLVGAQDKASSDELIKKLVGDSATEIVEVGSKKNGVNIEAVLSLDPDLVIMYPTKDDDETVKKLKDQNIKVISINPESIELLKNDILTVGKALGVNDRAEELIKYYEDKIKFVEEKVSSVEKKKVYMASSRGILSTVSSDMYQHEIIEAAGGINVASDLKGGSNDVTVEQLLNWNPDIIASVMYSEGGTPEEIKSNDQIVSLNAIKNDQIYQIPSNISAWDMPQPSSILSILWLSKTLYPEEFKDLNIETEANEFYSKFYGKSFEDLGGKL